MHPNCLTQGGLLPHSIPSGCTSILEEMREIGKTPFGKPSSNNSGNTYQWMKTTGEGLIGSCKMGERGCHHLTPLVSLSITRRDSGAPWASRMLTQEAQASPTDVNLSGLLLPTGSTGKRGTWKMAPWRSKQTKPEHGMILQEADLVSEANVEKEELL